MIIGARTLKHALMHGLLLGVCIMSGITNMHGQLFPGLEGEDLVEAIRDAYTPSQLLTDAQAKDTLYARIFNQDDTVHCIYSNLGRYLPDGVDPSQWLYGTGLEVNSLNLEHSWPQSKGAGKSTMGNRNMHHLFPSRTSINSDRADFPYNEISDPTTQKWYYLGTEQNSIPANNIDAYSEFKTAVFEPREAVKGDIARAMMYFWTIYRDDAETADPTFFEAQRSELCAWHEEDPVDDAELHRSQLIAAYQSGLGNPFIQDCSLAKRAYCPELATCAVGTAESIKGLIELDVRPEWDHIIVHYDRQVMMTVRIVNTMGQIVKQVSCLPDSVFSYAGLPIGIFLVHVSAGNEQFVDKVFLY